MITRTFGSRFTRPIKRTLLAAALKSIEPKPLYLCQQLYQSRFQNLCSDFSSFDAQRNGFLVDFFLHGCSPPIYHRCIRGGLPQLQAMRYRPAPSGTSCGTGAADSRTPICAGSACRGGRCPFPDAGASCVQTDCR